MGKQFIVISGFSGVRYTTTNPKNYKGGDTVTLTDAEYAALPPSLTRTIKAAPSTVSEPTYPTYPFKKKKKP
jgi:hypothetical protein